MCNIQMLIFDYTHYAYIIKLLRSCTYQNHRCFCLFFINLYFVICVNHQRAYHAYDKIYIVELPHPAIIIVWHNAYHRRRKTCYVFLKRHHNTSEYTFNGILRVPPPLTISYPRYTKLFFQITLSLNWDRGKSAHAIQPARDNRNHFSSSKT